ncbi:hypothetical protein RA27_00245 [Ruegeria sp. ANG-R]|uniref:DUF4261 domain-containing protein n=1 Tax=Ruegeria sp. ANG-R TaxID=1577903 RepID=UPI00057C7A71|nr:DUF4261 domain-containing protein [Ruegeria sp. ANG-R]KIC41889.1 hypothetical protein RA27_00245 [Ruegeria sp. ANG-R]
MDHDNPVVAIVLLKEASSIQQVLELGETQNTITEINRELSVPLIEYDVAGTSVSAAFDPNPLSEPIAQKAIEEARTWPEATTVLQQCSACLVIGTNEVVPKSADIVESYRAVSKLAALYAEKVEALALYWPSSGALVPTDFFVEAIQEDPISIGLIGTWVHIKWYRADSDKPNGRVQLAASTKGLSRFGDREIDFLPCDLKASEVARQILFVARYLIETGAEISSGDTLGLDDNMILRATLSDHGFSSNAPVIRLSIEKQHAIKSP